MNKRRFGLSAKGSLCLLSAVAMLGACAGEDSLREDALGAESDATETSASEGLGETTQDLSYQATTQSPAEIFLVKKGERDYHMKPVDTHYFSYAHKRRDGRLRVRRHAASLHTRRGRLQGNHPRDERCRRADVEAVFAQRRLELSNGGGDLRSTFCFQVGIPDMVAWESEYRTTEIWAPRQRRGASGGQCGSQIVALQGDFNGGGEVVEILPAHLQHAL